MITALSRDGLAASMSVTRARSGALFTSTSRAHSYAALSRSGYRHRQLSRPQVVSISWDVRCYSTPTTPPTEKAATSPEGIPLATLPKKAKVDLRPAPVKVTSTPSTTPPNPPAAPTAVSEGSSKPTTQSSAASPSSSEGIIDAAKHDVEAAAQHGILKPPPENAGRFMKLFHQAKELFKFYARGIKLINTNRKRSAAMRERVKNGGPPLTRWEARFIRTYKEDALKLIPFALIIIIAEEVIPLVVMYAPFILPSTCILPSQKERIDTKRRAKQAAYPQTMRDVFEVIRQRAKENPSADMHTLLDSQGLVAISGLLGHSQYTLDPLRRRRIQRHLGQVAADDALLLQEDMGKFLSEAELREALDERGILTDGLTRKQSQSKLRWWLTQVGKEDSVDPIVQRIVLIAQTGAGRA